MIPTAEEFLQDHYQISHFYDDKTDKMVCFSDDVKQAMIEFAKLHVKAALEFAYNNGELEYCGNPFDPEDLSKCINKESILNAYPEENIK